MTRLRSVDVKLEDGIEAAVGGTLDTHENVTLTAPSSRNRKEAANLKKICMSAIVGQAQSLTDEQKKEAQKEADKKKDSKMSPSDMMSMLASANADIDSLFDSFKALLINGCGHILSAPFTDDLFDDLSYADLENLCGSYLNDFLLQSLNQEGNGKKQKK